MALDTTGVTRTQKAGAYISYTASQAAMVFSWKNRNSSITSHRDSYGFICSGFHISVSETSAASNVTVDCFHWNYFPEKNSPHDYWDLWIVRSNCDIISGKISDFPFSFIIQYKHVLRAMTTTDEIPFTFAVQRWRQMHVKAWAKETKTIIRGWTNKPSFCFFCVTSQTVVTDECCELNKNIHIIAGMWYVPCPAEPSKRSLGLFQILTCSSISVCGVWARSLGSIDPA